MENLAPVLVRSDGGSRGNPGIAGIGFEIISEDKQFSAGAYIGEVTNNIAEYHALIWALENAQALGARAIRVQADSQLVIRQLEGAYKIKAQNLKPFFEKAKALLAQFASVELAHIPREQNKEADRRANEAMDARSLVGEYLVAYELGEQRQLSFNDLLAEQSAAPANAPTDHEQTQPEMRSTMNGTYSLTVKDHFDAAHNLYDYPGECRNLHGHTWDVEVTVVSSELDGLGLVCDFKDLKKALREVLNRYDHTYINENAPFDSISPTAENLAREICAHLSDILPKQVKVKEVAVWESPIARVGFSPAE